MHDVMTIGNATLDVFLSCESLDTIEHDDKKKIVLPYGEKLNVSQALFETGGGATNTATTFARQKLNVAIIGKIGNDFPASQVLSKLKEENINTQHLVQDENDSTDFSTIIWAPMGGSVILVNSGKGKLEVSDVDWDSLNTKWFYISSVEGNLEILKQVRTYCNLPGQGTKIAWNPGNKEIEHREIVFDLLPCIELLILNRREAMSLFESKSRHAELDSASNEIPDQVRNDNIANILNKFQNVPCNKLLITDGHNGSYYCNGDKWIHAGTFKVKRQETTGAGDAFGSAFVAGKIKGMSEEDCLKLASANAASVVTAPSAKKGILNQEQTREWMGKELEIEKL